MSDLGPGPEPPPVRDRSIPLIDLRDRIRLEHGVPAVSALSKLAEKELKELRKQAAVGRPKAAPKPSQPLWGINGIGTNGLLVTGIVLAWAIKPVLVIGLIAICVVVNLALRH